MKMIRELDWIEKQDKKGKSYFYAIGIKYYYKIVIKDNQLVSYRKEKLLKNNKYQEFFTGKKLQQLKDSLSKTNKDFVDSEFKSINLELSNLTNNWYYDL